MSVKYVLEGSVVFRARESTGISNGGRAKAEIACFKTSEDKGEVFSHNLYDAEGLKVIAVVSGVARSKIGKSREGTVMA